MHTQSALTVLMAAVLLPAAAGAQAVDDNRPSPNGEIKFVMHRIGRYRSEACGVGDFNGDGRLDIVAGPYLYLAPDWKPQKIRELSDAVDDKGKGYRDDFANVAMDVDGDGLLDVISCSWFKKRSTWYRNSGPSGGLWQESTIEQNGNFEAGDTWDLFGDGRSHVFLPVVKRTVWYELHTGTGAKRGFTTHVVSEKPLTWGIGVGDVNGDGRNDIIRPDAWFEAPNDIRKDKWPEHPLALGGKNGTIADTAQIYTYDVNGDGRNDIICSSAHGHGVFWYEQTGNGTKIAWKQHIIDDTWSQAHALVLADLNSDGVPEIITGKRFMAHNGGDPDAYGPLGLYHYTLKPGPEPTWKKQAISHNKGVGAGLNIVAVDLTGNGRLDIITTGKFGGPIWFENKGPIDVGDRKQLMIDKRFITDSKNITLRMNPAVIKGPVLLPDKPWESRVSYSVSVVEDGGRYKMWYLAEDKKTCNDTVTPAAKMEWYGKSPTSVRSSTMAPSKTTLSLILIN